LKPPVEKSFVVISKKGRDKGRIFVVLSSMDAHFVLICDGDTRKLDHPKKKKRIHLQSTPNELPEIIALYELHKLKDSDIRKALAPFQALGSISHPTGGLNAGPDSAGNVRQDADGNIKGGSLFVQK
jgi:hypothetical protein